MRVEFLFFNLNVFCVSSRAFFSSHRCFFMLKCSILCYSVLFFDIEQQMLREEKKSPVYNFFELICFFVSLTRLTCNKKIFLSLIGRNQEGNDRRGLFLLMDLCHFKDKQDPLMKQSLIYSQSYWEHLEMKNLY